MRFSLFPMSKDMGFLLLADRAGGTEREQNTTAPPITQTHSLITQAHSSLRPAHHSDSLITQTHSSLGL
eukprot:1678747-Pyramimonas_sp.AAC.1